MVTGRQDDGSVSVTVVGAGLGADVVRDLLDSQGFRIAPGTEQRDASALSVVVARGLPDVDEAVTVHAAAGPVLVVAERASLSAAAALLTQGATSVVPEDAGADVLAGAVRLTAAGYSVVDPALVRRSGPGPRASDDPQVEVEVDELTQRERDVLRQLARGRTAKEVARQLGIAVKTVETHKANIFTRLGVRTQSQAVAVAVRAGMDLDEPVRGRRSHFVSDRQQHEAAGSEVDDVAPRRTSGDTVAGADRSSERVGEQ